MPHIFHSWYLFDIYIFQSHLSFENSFYNLIYLFNGQVSLGEQFSSLLSISNALQVILMLITLLIWVTLVLILNPQSLILDP